MKPPVEHQDKHWHWIISAKENMPTIVRWSPNAHMWSVYSGSSLQPQTVNWRYLGPAEPPALPLEPLDALAIGICRVLGCSSSSKCRPANKCLEHEPVMRQAAVDGLKLMLEGVQRLDISALLTSGRAKSAEPILQLFLEVVDGKHS